MKKVMIIATAVTAVLFIQAGDIVIKDIPNLDFEKENKDGTCYAWSSFAESCYDAPHDGEACAKQKSNGSNWDVIMHDPVFSAEPNTKYRITVWNRNTLTSGSAQFGVRFVDASRSTMDKAIKGGYIWRSVKCGETKWTEYKIEFTTPEGLAYLNIYFKVNNPKGDVFWDSIKVEKITP